MESANNIMEYVPCTYYKEVRPNHQNKNGGRQNKRIEDEKTEETRRRVALVLLSYSRMTDKERLKQEVKTKQPSKEE